MGWITLSLRRNELTSQHNALELDALSNSKQQRQNNRNSLLEQTKITNIFNEYIAEQKEAYQDETDTLDYYYTMSSEGLISTKSSNYLSSDDYQEALNDAYENYQTVYNALQTQCENECTILEEEATTTSTQLETRETKIESEMESVSNELDSVKDQISSDVESTTIQLG